MDEPSVAIGIRFYIVIWRSINQVLLRSLYIIEFIEVEVDRSYLVLGIYK